MVGFLRRLPQSNYSRQWSVAFGIGAFTWFAIVCFARLLPAPLQLLTMLVPIACFSFALYILPKWQEEGRRSDLIASLAEREWSHNLMNQHHFNIAGMDLENHAATQELVNLFAIDEAPIQSAPVELQESTTPIAQQAAKLLQLKQDVFQSAGEVGWALVEYLAGRGSQHCDNDGFITVEKLRSNWGRNFGLKTEPLRQLLIALSNAGAGEWKDANLKDWRLTINLNSV